MPLTIQRHRMAKSDSPPVQILPPHQPVLKRIVDDLIKNPERIPQILKAKRYLSARLDGKKKTVARSEAGFPKNASDRQILSSPMAKMLLDELVTQKIPDVDVAERLKEMWDSMTVQAMYNPVKKAMVKIKRPNWDMRKYAMDKRLALGGYTNGALPEDREKGIVTNIQFTTVNINSQEATDIP